jgi:hypothetical protein
MPRGKNAAAQVAPQQVTAAVTTAAQPAAASTFTPPSVEELEAGGYTTTSAKIRRLRELGGENYGPGPISRHLGIIYQHAYNVLSKPLKRKEQAAAQAENQQAEGSNGGDTAQQS